MAGDESSIQEETFGDEDTIEDDIGNITIEDSVISEAINTTQGDESRGYSLTQASPAESAGSHTVYATSSFESATPIITATTTTNKSHESPQPVYTPFSVNDRTYSDFDSPALSSIKPASRRHGRRAVVSAGTVHASQCTQAQAIATLVQRCQRKTRAIEETKRNTSPKTISSFHASNMTDYTSFHSTASVDHSGETRSSMRDALAEAAIDQGTLRRNIERLTQRHRVITSGSGRVAGQSIGGCGDDAAAIHDLKSRTTSHRAAPLTVEPQFGAVARRERIEIPLRLFNRVKHRAFKAQIKTEIIKLGNTRQLNLPPPLQPDLMLSRKLDRLRLQQDLRELQLRRDTGRDVLFQDPVYLTAEIAREIGPQATRDAAWESWKFTQGEQHGGTASLSPRQRPSAYLYAQQALGTSLALREKYDSLGLLAATAASKSPRTPTPTTTTASSTSSLSLSTSTERQRLHAPREHKIAADLALLKNKVRVATGRTTLYSLESPHTQRTVPTTMITSSASTATTEGMMTPVRRHTTRLDDKTTTIHTLTPLHWRASSHTTPSTYKWTQQQRLQEEEETRRAQRNTRVTSSIAQSEFRVAWAAHLDKPHDFSA